LATTALAATACPALVATPMAPLRKVVLAARWVFIPLAITASAAPATTGRRFRRAARDAPWVGIHQVGTASRAAEACPAGSSRLLFSLSCRAPERLLRFLALVSADPALRQMIAGTLTADEVSLLAQERGFLVSGSDILRIDGQPGASSPWAGTRWTPSGAPT